LLARQEELSAEWRSFVVGDAPSLAASAAEA